MSQAQGQPEVPEEQVEEFGAGVASFSDAPVSILSDVKGQGGAKRDKKVTIDRSSQALASMTPEERVTRIRESVERTPKHRDLLYKALVYVSEQPCSYEEAEEYLAQQPEAKSALQAPRTLLDILVRAGGIEVTELDEEGAVVTQERKDELRAQGADEEEVEDLVCDWRLSVTTFALTFIGEYSPGNRLRALLDEATADEVEAYRTIVRLCATKQMYPAIEKELRGTAATRPDEATGMMGIQPSTFIERLNRAGGIAWEGGWVTTAEGRACVE